MDAKLVALAAAVNILTAAGIAVDNVIKTVVADLHPGKTDEELNAICESVKADSLRRKALADADAAGPVN